MLPFQSFPCAPFNLIFSTKLTVMSLLSKNFTFLRYQSSSHAHFKKSWRPRQGSSPHFSPNIVATEPWLTATNINTSVMALSAASTPLWLPMEPATTLKHHESNGNPETPATTAANANDPVTVAALMPARPLVPTCASDWESRKRIIRELYMDQNMILNEVIEIMIDKYKFKATQVFPPRSG